jgi:hypothetical protein
MPYRRLPNTDNARIKALHTLIEKAAETDFQQLPLSQALLTEAQEVLTRLERLSARYQQMYTLQVKANKQFLVKMKNVRMYLSHFVQVLYLSVIRAEIKEEQLAYYGLGSEKLVVPDMTTHEQILSWGEKIIEGENERISRGGVPIYNPSIAKVKVMYSLFREAYQNQLLHKKATNRILGEITDYRETADQLICRIWDEVETSHMELPAEKRLELNRRYGIVYYYRKGEMVE